MRKGLIGVLIWLGLLAGCNAEPTYSDVSFITYNYTPWTWRRFVSVTRRAAWPVPASFPLAAAREASLVATRSGELTSP